MATLVDYDARSLRAQMKRANRCGTRWVLILGDDEIERCEVTVKDMEERKQTAIERAKVVQWLSAQRRHAGRRYMRPEVDESDRDW